MPYDADAIEVLSGLQAIRARPEMYAGRLDDPAMFNRLIQEAMCLAVDETAGGHCARVRVSVCRNNFVTVRDDGCGLSMTPDAYGNVPAEVLFTQLHACRDSKANARLKHTCCGIGIVAVNALSEWFQVRNFREGVCWMQEYRRGEPLAPFRRGAETAETGLELSFLPDPSVFSGLRFDARKLARWVRGTGAGFGRPTITEWDKEPTVLVFEAQAHSRPPR